MFDKNFFVLFFFRTSVSSEACFMLAVFTPHGVLEFLICYYRFQPSFGFLT